MKKYINPNTSEWNRLCKRPSLPVADLTPKVQSIIDAVSVKGDAALIEYAIQFDKVQLQSLQVSESEIEEAIVLVDEDLKQAIQIAAANIAAFHKVQLKEENAVETMTGVTCWRKNVAIEKVGLYIPGGSAPLFSTLLMLAIPAQIAGCDEIILCTPCNASGKINPAILYTAQFLGLKNIFKIGGAQAIAAMALGTETVPQVYKILGPGNQYVTKAKEMVQQLGVAIDMPAGPSEVLVIADKTAVPAYVAADLLAQAEHGADSQVLLVTTSEAIVNQVQKEIEMQLNALPRKDITKQALDNSLSIVLTTIQECLAFSNMYAPEHLILSVKNAEDYCSQIRNAGSVFIGNFTPESAGDYASGTNHTLPTNGYAKAYSGVSVDTFLKKITFQKITKEGLLNIGKTVETMAAAETLDAHKNAVNIRLK